MAETDLDVIEKSIYFLKVSELKQLLTDAGIKPSGSKQSMINSLIAYANGDSTRPSALQLSDAERALRKKANQYDPTVFIVPGVYTNNRKNRKRFHSLIGHHISYTTYGMDWIKDRWAEGTCPTYQAFAEFWQEEYLRRKNNGAFKSKQTLQRVQFFRAMKDRNLSKGELEDAWARERAEHSAKAEKIFRDLIKRRNKIATS